MLTLPIDHPPDDPKGETLRLVISTLVGLMPVKPKRSSFRPSPVFSNGYKYDAPQEQNLHLCRNVLLH